VELFSIWAILRAISGMVLINQAMAILVAVALLFTVPLVHAQGAAAEIGTPFKLKFSQQPSIDSERIGITFANVTEDSRCPSDVVCIRAGQATITVSVEANGTDAGQYSLTVGSNESKMAATFGQYSIKLVSLDPYPVSTTKTDKSDYVATVVVSKVSANSAGVLVKAGGDFGAIAGWSTEKGKGTLVMIGRDPEGPRREILRFVPSEAKCASGPEARECTDGQITPACLVCRWQSVHLEVSGDKLHLTLVSQNSTEYTLDVKQIRTKPGSTVTLAEGQRDGPLLVQKIGADSVKGLNYVEYPVARADGIPITLHIGDKASNGCTVTLTLVKILDGKAGFSKSTDYNRMCPI
jgi:hypothetical protein